MRAKWWSSIFILPIQTVIARRKIKKRLITIVLALVGVGAGVVVLEVGALVVGAFVVGAGVGEGVTVSAMISIASNSHHPHPALTRTTLFPLLH